MLVRSIIGVLAVALLAVAGGCGRETVRGSSSGGEISIEVFEYGFKPNLIEAAPGPTTFIVRNAGVLAHNFTVERWGRRIGQTRTSLRGTKLLTLDLKRGVYTFRCTVPHHDDLGETGKIVVAD